MGRGPPLTDEEKGRIFAYADLQLGTREIARRVNRSPDAVRHVLSPPQPANPKPRKGRRPLLTEREVRLVVRTAATGDYTADQLHRRFSLSCSVRTVRRLLARVDFLVYRKMERTLPLTPAHRAARIAFATHMLATYQAHWDRTVFSDEKKFNLDGPDGFKYYWRDLRRPARQYVTRQMGGGSVMVWGAFCAYGTSELAFLVGRQNSGNYTDTMGEYMYPFAHYHYGTEFFYQQDNASIHSSRQAPLAFDAQYSTILPYHTRALNYGRRHN